MIRVESSGNFDKTRAFFNRIFNNDELSNLDRYGQMGVEALASATPVRSGLTANSWGYRIIDDGPRTTIEWYNDNMVEGTPLVILLQYGHATGTGGYVEGHDFINPAIQPIFDMIADEVWKEVTK